MRLLCFQHISGECSSFIYLRFNLVDLLTIIFTRGPRAIRTPNPPRIYDDGGIPFSTSLACAEIITRANKAKEENEGGRKTTDEEGKKPTDGIHIFVLELVYISGVGI